MNATAHYYDFYTSDQIVLTELIRLRKNDAGTGWTGKSGDKGPNLLLNVDAGGLPQQWIITMTFRYGTAPAHTMTFYHYQDPRNPRWDTRILENTLHAHDWWGTVHILA